MLPMKSHKAPELPSEHLKESRSSFFLFLFLFFVMIFERISRKLSK